MVKGLNFNIHKYFSSVKWYMKCFIYWTADFKSSKAWSSQLYNERNLSNCVEKPEKKNPLKSWLFQASLRNCLNCVHNCDDHGLLTFPVLIIIIIIGNLQYSVLFKWSNFVADGHKDTLSSWRGWKEFKADISGIGPLSKQKILINTFDTKLSKRAT